MQSDGEHKLSVLWLRSIINAFEKGMILREHGHTFMPVPNTPMIFESIVKTFKCYRQKDRWQSLTGQQSLVHGIWSWCVSTTERRMQRGIWFTSVKGFYCSSWPGVEKKPSHFRGVHCYGVETLQDSWEFDMHQIHMLVYSWASCGEPSVRSRHGLNAGQSSKLQKYFGAGW